MVAVEEARALPETWDSWNAFGKAVGASAEVRIDLC